MYPKKHLERVLSIISQKSIKVVIFFIFCRKIRIWTPSHLFYSFLFFFNWFKLPTVKVEVPQYFQGKRPVIAIWMLCRNHGFVLCLGISYKQRHFLLPSSLQRQSPRTCPAFTIYGVTFLKLLIRHNIELCVWITRIAIIRHHDSCLSL